MLISSLLSLLFLCHGQNTNVGFSVLNIIIRRFSYLQPSTEPTNQISSMTQFRLFLRDFPACLEKHTLYKGNNLKKVKRQKTGSCQKSCAKLPPCQGRLSVICILILEHCSVPIHRRLGNRTKLVPLNIRDGHLVLVLQQDKSQLLP